MAGISMNFPKDCSGRKGSRPVDYNNASSRGDTSGSWWHQGGNSYWWSEADEYSWHADAGWSDASLHWTAGGGQWAASRTGSAWSGTPAAAAQLPQQRAAATPSASAAASPSVSHEQHPRATLPTPTSRASPADAEGCRPAAAPKKGQGAGLQLPPKGSTSLKSGMRSSAPVAFVQLRLRILDSLGSTRSVDIRVERRSHVRGLKAKHFAKELASGARIRVMLLGQQLEDNATWAGVPDNSLLQCFVVWTPAPPTTSRDNDMLQATDGNLSLEQSTRDPIGESDSEAAYFIAMAIGLCLACLWVVYFLIWDPFGESDKESIRGENCRNTILAVTVVSVVVSGGMCAKFRTKG